jgi:hypothetical protein
MATKKSSRWIQGAVKKPGQLHRDLGVPQGKTIPVAKVRAAAKGKGKVAQRARFALATRGLSSKSTAKSTTRRTVKRKRKKK